jgi:GNAT superfamily N-acetyltransferase
MTGKEARGVGVEAAAVDIRSDPAARLTSMLRRTIYRVHTNDSRGNRPNPAMELDLEPNTFPAGHVRRIWAADAANCRAHLLRLDREGRNMRFAGTISDDRIAEYSASNAEPGRVLHGFFHGRDLRGAAEIVPLNDAERTGEAAFSVEQGYRRQGVGHELMARTIRAARLRGIERLLVRCLPTNRAMQNLARKFAADLIFESGDVLGLIDPPPASGELRRRGRRRLARLGARLVRSSE